MTLNQITELLKTNGYKITEPRKVILTLLLKNMNTILSTEEIYLLAVKINNKINRSTVYRNIETLVELKLLYKSVKSDGLSRYKIICQPEHHHHLICDICGSIVIYTNCENDAYQKFASQHGFQLTGHTLELHGICQPCQMKTSY